MRELDAGESAIIGTYAGAVAVRYLGWENFLYGSTTVAGLLVVVGILRLAWGHKPRGAE